jgi:hypothetical protein
MPPPETGKQRASRIPLDYYKQPNSLERWKLWLGLAVLLLTTGWLAAGLLRSDQGRTDYSRGPVAAVHATWEDNCTVCHIPFSPIRGNIWASGDETNKKCRACHAGPTHHENQKFEPACASCHRDHRGRDASLTHITDSDCVQCHADLGGSIKPGEKRIFQNVVTRFDTDHPEFRSVAKGDPGKLKFSHKVHMLAGFKADFTLGDIPEAQRKRYRQLQPAGQNRDSDLVQLQCASCHRLDSGDFGLRRSQLPELPAAALLPRRSAGAYMLPIVYENQCQACHPLTFERKKADDPLSGFVAVRHRLQPKQIRDFLQRHYTAKALQGDFKGFDKKPTRPLPGKNLLEESPELRTFISTRVAKAERLLLSDNTCGKCHEGAKAGGWIEPPEIPDVWFKHASFNHSAHRAVDCRSCHPQAYPLLADGKTANLSVSAHHSDVMIPHRDNCRQCHAPQTKSEAKVLGGARFDCNECHRYHNGDHPWQGIGAQRRGIPEQDRRDIEEFLFGGAGGASRKSNLGRNSK